MVVPRNHLRHCDIRLDLSDRPERNHGDHRWGRSKCSGCCSLSSRSRHRVRSTWGLLRRQSLVSHRSACEFLGRAAGRTPRKIRTAIGVGNTPDRRARRSVVDHCAIHPGWTNLVDTVVRYDSTGSPLVRWLSRYRCSHLGDVCLDSRLRLRLTVRRRSHPCVLARIRSCTHDHRPHRGRAVLHEEALRTTRSESCGLSNRRSTGPVGSSAARCGVLVQSFRQVHTFENEFHCRCSSGRRCVGADK